MATRKTVWEGVGWYSISAPNLEKGTHYARTPRDLSTMVRNAGKLFGTPVKVQKL